MRLPTGVMDKSAPLPNGVEEKTLLLFIGGGLQYTPLPQIVGTYVPPA